MTQQAGSSPAVWVLAEVALGQVQKVTFELIADAKKLASIKKLPVEVVVLCAPAAADKIVEQLRPYEPARIHLLTGEGLTSYTTEAYLAALAPLISEARPLLVVVPASANGRDLAVPLAVRTGRGYVPHVITMRQSGDKLDFSRVSHGGRVHVESTWIAGPEGNGLLCTMKPGVADATPPNAAAKAPDVVRHTAAVPAKVKVRVLEHLPPEPRNQDIRDAERLVAGGRGVGGPEGFSAVQELADALHASVAASRVAVDLGWIPFERQVGQTGKTVMPQLYVAAGISGASHHLLGMKGSEKIVVINTDKKAPILSVAHLSVIGNLHEILPALAKRIRESSPKAEGKAAS